MVDSRHKKTLAMPIGGLIEHSPCGLDLDIFTSPLTTTAGMAVMIGIMFKTSATAISSKTGSSYISLILIRSLKSKPTLDSPTVQNRKLTSIPDTSFLTPSTSSLAKTSGIWLSMVL